MFRGEVIRKLQAEGYPITAAKIRHAREKGWLKPRPKEAPIGQGAHVYTQKHVEQLRRYLENVRPGPRPIHPRPPRYVDPGLAERQRALDEALRQIEASRTVS